jgi:hypothetical protein
MIVVSGCPRSGTSLTMDIMREALGDDNIIGSKFPQENRAEIIPQREEESDAHFAVREYYFNKWKEQNPEREDDFQDMNPNGFWECRYSVIGIGAGYGTPRFNYLHARNLEEELLINEKNKVVKIVSQGLLASDQRFIDKVVYLIRHPRNVAKSQERLKRGFDVEYGGEKHNIFEGLTIHTPEMYIDVTLQACRWILDNPDTPVLFVKFDDLQANPEETIDKIAEFVGYGDFEKSKKLVEPKLNRSSQEDIEHNLWEDADLIYDMFLEGKYEEILTLFEDPKRQFNRLRQRWHCTRINMQVNCFDCEKCVSNPMIQENYKNRSRSMGIDYLNEPCMYECGMNVDDDNPISIEQSIKDNTWAITHVEEKMVINEVRNFDCEGED